MANVKVGLIKKLMRGGANTVQGAIHLEGYEDHPDHPLTTPATITVPDDKNICGLNIVVDADYVLGDGVSATPGGSYWRPAGYCSVVGVEPGQVVTVDAAA